MTWEIAFVLAVAAGAVALFVSEKLSTDMVAMIVMVVLLASGVVTPEEGFAGFANTATVTVGAMFVLSAGLFRSGAVSFVGDLLGKLIRRSVTLAAVALMLIVGVISAFLNNTAAVAILIPVVIGVARDAGRSPSRLLMPLSFASMFGGVCTLVGTSTNILASSIAVRHGMPAFGMFEFTQLGVLFFVAGVVYMSTVGIRLIPARRGEGDLTESFGMGDYLTEIVLGPTCRSVGREIVDAPLVKELDVTVLDIVRDDRHRFVPNRRTVLLEGDVLKVRGSVETIAKLQTREGIELRQQRLHDDALSRTESRLVEAVVAPNSSELIGRSLKQLRFRETYGGTALALRHRGELLHDRMEDTPLLPGDALLLDVRADQVAHLQHSKLFLVVSEVALPTFRREKMAVALAIMAGVVGAATAGVAPIAVTAAVGAVSMVLSRCLSSDEAYEAVEWRVLFLLAGMLALGTAMERTGAAQLIAGGIVETIGGLGVTALISGLFLLTMLLTEVMSNNATVALLTPIAIAAGEATGVDPRPLVVAVMFAASSSFMTPIGYQTNTMIYGPGQYRFVDFVKVGAPLNVVFWILGTLLIPRFFPP